MYEVGTVSPCLRIYDAHVPLIKMDLYVYFRGAWFDIFHIHEFYYGFQDEVGIIMEIAYSKNKLFKGNPLVCDYFWKKVITSKWTC